MRAGRMRHRVYIQAQAEEKDSSGHRLDQWSTLEEDVPAEIKGLTGNQAVSRSGEYADATHRVSMRFYPGLTPENRLLFGSRALDILYINNVDERDIELQMICRERIA